MADFEKQELVVKVAEEEEEKENFLEGMAVLDFDKLCSTVALQTQGKWTKLGDSESGQEDDKIGDFDGVFRMWEGEVLDCLDDRPIAIESASCPCYRFGKNMRRAGFGSCFLQGTIYFALAISALFNCIAFAITKRHCFLYLAVGFTISLGAYLGFFRTQMKRKFNIRGTDSSLDDCIYHLVCPCCTLCQEARTLEMNNVQNGIWHGRGDTICIGSYGDTSKAFFELHPPRMVSGECPELYSLQKNTNSSDQSSKKVMDSEHLIVPSP